MAAGVTRWAAPPYGTATLADLGPSVLAALGVAAEPNALRLPDVARVCLLLVDGLGWNQLRAAPDAAPYLSSLDGGPITAGFPSTTVTSLASLGTGAPAGTHGFTGYTSYVEEVPAVVNWLAWRPVSESTDLRDRLVPEALQPLPTVWERADAAGIATTMCTFENFAGSGLTRSVLRGGRWGGTYAEGDAVARAAEAAELGNRALVYAYVSALDLVGHMRGPDTDAWRAQLAIVDRIAAELGRRLPSDAVLIVTADHGMVRVPEDRKVDFDSTPALRDGVRELAGEPRMRHVHTEPGAASEVARTWADELGADWVVLERETAIESGLFGPTVSTTARTRIGDVVAFALGDGGVVERRRLPRLSTMPGQHGSVTDDEMLVPLLRSR